jgi:AcrR family transcriptional regulator
MLAEMPASDISLNELSRRVGLAKSNVLRYFESREAILLELCNSAAGAWIDEVAEALGGAIDLDATPTVRADQVANVLATSLAQHPVLCDLISTQAAVLEHNISTEAVLRYKRISTGHVDKLATLVVDYLPELGDDGAGRFAALLVMMAAAVWTYSQPSSAVLAAYEADPALASYRVEFTSTLRETLEVALSGLLTRSEKRWGV